LFFWLEGNQGEKPNGFVEAGALPRQAGRLRSLEHEGFGAHGSEPSTKPRAQSIPEKLICPSFDGSCFFGLRVIRVRSPMGSSKQARCRDRQGDCEVSSNACERVRWTKQRSRGWRSGQKGTPLQGVLTFWAPQKGRRFSRRIITDLKERSEGLVPFYFPRSSIHTGTPQGLSLHSTEYYLFSTKKIC